MTYSYESARLSLPVWSYAGSSGVPSRDNVGASARVNFVPICVALI
jgi:hypothetical protein